MTINLLLNTVCLYRPIGGSAGEVSMKFGIPVQKWSKVIRKNIIQTHLVYLRANFEISSVLDGMLQVALTVLAAGAGGQR